MAVVAWLGQHWFALTQTAGIIAALGVAAAGLLLDAKARRVGNLIALTDRHRTLWERMCSDRKLARILDPAADPKSSPVTPEEELFVIFLILHLANTYFTMKTGLLKQPQGLCKDVQLLFSLPIPRKVWRQVRDLQDEPFVKFVEDCLTDQDSAQWHR
jgi:hypothetical protein